mmetsp:Transcript_71722/g.105113  ORF Transcript_71722/g.105113 Transcript_71722/m.105113 type:complete len:107 (+) Transcript_71722:214-534(+)
MSQQHRGNHAQRVVCRCTVYKLQHMTRATIYASTTPAPAYMDCNTLQHTATHVRHTCNTLHSKDVLWRSPTCPSLAVSSHQPLRPVHGGGNPMNIMLYIIYVYYMI